MHAAKISRGPAGVERWTSRASSRRRRIIPAAAIAVAAGLVLSSPAGARPAVSASTIRPNVLSAVDGTSTTNAWAVGYTTVGSLTKTLIEHWNGHSWKIQKSPNMGRGNNVLTGVAAISPTAAWAVGTGAVSGRSKGLIEYWNGTVWAVQKSAQLVGAQLNLSGVSATSTTNAWVVGTSTADNIGHTFIEHWNGTTWTQQASPNATTNTNFLSGVAAISGARAWVVGAAFEDHSTLQNPLVEQSNGIAWSAQPSQSPRAAPQDTLAGVSATPTGAVWAAGSFMATDHRSRTLIERLGPTGWTIQKSPNRGRSSDFLTGVAATSTINAWAAGQSDAHGIKTLIEHWSGTSWVIQPSPDKGTQFSVLNGVDATSSTNAWAVGDFGGTGGAQQTLIEHFNGSAWKIQKSPVG
jgi:hypothetical protein